MGMHVDTCTCARACVRTYVRTCVRTSVQTGVMTSVWTRCTDMCMDMCTDICTYICTDMYSLWRKKGVAAPTTIQISVAPKHFSRVNIQHLSFTKVPTVANTKTMTTNSEGIDGTDCLMLICILLSVLTVIDTNLLVTDTEFLSV